MDSGKNSLQIGNFECCFIYINTSCYLIFDPLMIAKKLIFEIGGADNIKVGIRVRPFNKKEKDSAR
jgi:hypothetical protein